MAMISVENIFGVGWGGIIKKYFSEGFDFAILRACLKSKDFTR